MVSAEYWYLQDIHNMFSRNFIHRVNFGGRLFLFLMRKQECLTSKETTIRECAYLVTLVCPVLAPVTLTLTR